MGKKIIHSPFSGELLPLEEVPDPVFAQGIVGKGVAIKPSSGIAYAPVEGVISAVVKGGHALAIKDEEGVEILIHIGIDTVNLKGEGFNCLVKEGQMVSKGEKLIEFDIGRIEGAGLPIISPVVVITPNYDVDFPVPFGSMIEAITSPILVIYPVEGGI